MGDVRGEQAGPAADGAPGMARQFAPGETVGRYVVGPVLGSGGMGTVYAAYDPQLDRRVALKLMHRVSDQMRLFREGKALAKLAHPNIVSVFDVGSFEQRVFLAMELVDGPTLRSWLSDGPRSPRQVLTVLLDAGRGLAAAHDAGLVHRDFKPENVLVGRDGRVRVVDFGITAPADPIADVSTDQTLRSTGDREPGADDDTPAKEGRRRARTREDNPLEGTPEYMAPERLYGAAAEPRTDQYSFCACIFEALAGERVDERPTLQPAAALPVAGAPDASAVPALPQGPPWLDRILARGLARDPSDRYPSMHALLTEIETGLASEQDRAQLIAGRYQLLAGVASLPMPAYRAFDRLSGRVVTLAEIPQWNDSSGPSWYAAPADLGRHPHLVAVLARATAGDRSYVVLDLQNPRTLLEEAKGRPVSVRLTWLAQVLRALVYLHRQGRWHGRLGPEWIVVENEIARLLVPVGAATNEVSRPDPTDSACGTASSPTDLAAVDLAAVAAIVDALLPSASTARLQTDGRTPFGHRHPAPSDRGVETLSAELQAALDTLRAHGRGDRPLGTAHGYPDAERALVALEAASGGTLRGETIETRESTLQAAPLFGRDGELEALQQVLLATRNGQGGGVLLAGESGIGKSRLAQEVCRIAFSSGFEVLRAHAATEAAFPYQLWREPLRELCANEDPGDRDAAVLLSVVPDLPILLGRPIDPAPDVDPRSHQLRIVETVTRLLIRRRRPTLLLLEDLQWAERESVDVLRALAEQASRAPLLLLGTVRSDERSNLPDALANESASLRPGAMRVFHLGRLTPEALERAAAWLLGGAQRAAPLLALLDRETEGNPFFLVECVRALAENAGSLARVADAPPPERLFPGGVREAVARRLATIPAAHRRALELSAVMGRKIDPAVIAAAFPDLDATAWIDASQAAHVVVQTEGVLRFQHDKLREGLLLGLSPGDALILHRIAAVTIERLRSGEREHLGALAHHWGAAGEPNREAHYAARAGEHAIASGALEEGIRLLERALALRDVLPPDDPERTRLVRQLGDAYFFLGDFARADRYLESAIAFLGHRLPTTQRGWMGLALRVLLRRLGQGLRRRATNDDAATATTALTTTTPATTGLTTTALATTTPTTTALTTTVLTMTAARDERLIEISRAATRRAQMGGYRFETVEILALSLLAVELGERGGEDNAFALGVLGHVAALRGLSRLARRYFDRARAIAEKLGDRAALVGVILLEAVFLLVTGRRTEAETAIREGLALALEVGDRVNAAGMEELQGLAHALTGSLEGMRACYERAGTLVKGYSAEHEHTCTAGTALSLALLGRLAEARVTGETCLAQVPPEMALTRVALLTGLIFVETWTGNWRRALQLSDEAIRLYGTSTAVPPPCLAFVEAPIEAYLLAWRCALESGRRDEAAVLESKVRRLLRGLKTWGRWYPIGRASAHLYRGQALWLAGRHRRARRAFALAIRAAEQMGLKWHAAHAHFALGNAVGAHSSVGRRHLVTARDLYRSIGAIHHLGVVERIVEESQKEIRQGVGEGVGGGVGDGVRGAAA